MNSLLPNFFYIILFVTFLSSKFEAKISNQYFLAALYLYLYQGYLAYLAMISIWSSGNFGGSLPLHYYNYLAEDMANCEATVVIITNINFNAYMTSRVTVTLPSLWSLFIFLSTTSWTDHHHLLNQHQNDGEWCSRWDQVAKLLQVEFSAPPPDPSNPFLTVKYIPALIPLNIWPLSQPNPFLQTFRKRSPTQAWTTDQLRGR